MRKLIGFITNQNVNKENLPSKIQQIKITHDYQPKFDTSINDASTQVILLQKILSDPTFSLQNPPHLIITQEIKDYLNAELRDLLYFLYDYKYFETCNVHNESSIIQAQNISTGGRRSNIQQHKDSYQEETSQSSIEEIPESQSPQSQQNSIIQEDNGEEFQRQQQPPEPMLQEPQLDISNGGDDENEDEEEAQKKLKQYLPTIFEDDNEQSFNMSMEQRQLKLQQVPHDHQIKYNGEKSSKSNSFKEEYASHNEEYSEDYSQEIQTKDIQVIDQVINLRKVDDLCLNLPKQQTIEIASIKIDLKPKKKTVEVLQEKVMRGSVFIQFECNLYPLPIHDSYVIEGQRGFLQQESNKTYNQGQSQVLRNFSKQKLIESFFHSKNLKLKRQHNVVLQESPSQQELSEFMQNDQFDHQFKVMMMNIFTPDSVGSAESLKQMPDFATYIRVDPSLDSRDEQNTVDHRGVEEKSSVLECSESEMEKENSSNQNNKFLSQQPCGDFLDYLDSEFQLISQDQSKIVNQKGMSQESAINSPGNSQNQFAISGDDVMGIFQLPIPFEEMTNKKSKIKIRHLNSSEKEKTDSLCSQQPPILHIDTERKLRILKSIKNGKFSFKTKKPLQSGRVVYKQSYSTVVHPEFNGCQLVRDGNQAQCVVDGGSNLNCPQCQGTNWNQKYNMPCTECIDTPIISHRDGQPNNKYKKAKKSRRNDEMPRQIQVLDEDVGYSLSDKEIY